MKIQKWHRIETAFSRSDKFSKLFKFASILHDDIIYDPEKYVKEVIT